MSSNTDHLKTNAPRIAIPVPHSADPKYAERSLPQYEAAVRAAGGEPVRIELDQTAAQVMRADRALRRVLLPGSGADVDPAKYGAARHEKRRPPIPNEMRWTNCCWRMPTRGASLSSASAMDCNR
jgi:gamma-glutamyl-gamma-aminobutyrate hydrolase PuuD